MVIFKKPRPKVVPPRPEEAFAAEPSSTLCPLFVWGIWTALVLAGSAFIATYHTAVPFGEDWDQMIPWIAGDVPVTLHTLWEPIGEYRPFLLRLVVWGLLRLSDGDYWTLMLFQLACLGALSFAMIRTAKCLRGRTDYTDAFFPMVLLHWVFADSLFFAETINMLLPTVIAGTVLLVIARKGTQLTLGTGVLAGVCLILLPLASVYGMVYMPALMSWFVFSGVRAWWTGAPHGRRNGLVILALAAAALALFGFYFVDLEYLSLRAQTVVEWPTALWAALGLLTLSWGPAAQPLWPFSGDAMAILLVLVIAALLAAMWRNPARNRPLGLLMFLGAIATLALAYGRGRGVLLAENPVEPYYYLITVLTPCCMYLAWGVWRPRTMGHFVQMCLFTGMACAFSLDVNFEFRDEQYYWNGKRSGKDLRAFEQDLRDGMPAFRILARRGNTVVGVSNSEPKDLNAAMHQLHHAGVGPFRLMKPDPVFRELPVSLVPSEAHEVTWENGMGHAGGSQPYLAFSLPQQTFVAGIRIQGSYLTDSPSGKDMLNVAWKGNGADYPATPQYVGYPQRWTDATIYVADTIDQFRIYFRNDSDFQVSGITVLTLPAGAENMARP